MIVIVLLGILAAIAIPSWFGLVEARRVESAANQLASDLRLAHSRTSNQVGTSSVVTLHPDREAESVGPDYVLYGDNRTLPGTTRITAPASTTVLTFRSNGTVDFNGTISLKNGSGDSVVIRIYPLTSDVEVME